MRTALERGMVVWAALSSAWLVGLGRDAQAVLVPYGDSGSGGSTQTNNTPTTQCTTSQVNRCQSEHGGVATFEDEQCVCTTYDWVPRQITNASRGDVGIVPIAGNDGGEEVVRAALSAAGQAHRHAVMFYDNGTKIRHNTMYSSQIGVLTPLVGQVRLDNEDLRNGTPGALSQSIDDAFDTGRLENEGLVLKPKSENDRQLFKDAVDRALDTSAYYKLAEYTDSDHMDLPWNDSRQGNLRGTHCSGYVTWAFSKAGFNIPAVSYDQDMRRRVARAIYRATLDSVDDSMDGMGGLESFAISVFKPNAAENIANQVTNCFAGLGCNNLERDWDTKGPGTGLSSSPDNLLPTSFLYAGSTTYDWNGKVLSAGNVTISTGTTSSPFTRVEAQSVGGGYYVQGKRLTSW